MAPIGAARANLSRVPSFIPDSGGTHQYNAIEGSGSTLGDSIGSLDGTINGASWVTGGAGARGAYLQYDSSNNDNVNLTTDSRTELDHFVRNGEGTVFVWINPDTTSSRQTFVGSTISTDDVGFAVETRPADSEYLSFKLLGGGNQDLATTSTDLLVTNTWQPVAATGDGSNFRIYHGDPNNNYTVSEVASTSVTNTRSSILDNNVSIGLDTSTTAAPFDGGMDIAYFDSVGQSQSEIQQFVDDSKSFY